ncbi:MAG TPA: DUF6569 family protein [Pyrinomonadaceae bacterium]|jgi:hypothetical protein|nr:DUF6569 family protein [Pyrinomonadaceae bacterium]
MKRQTLWRVVGVVLLALGIPLAMLVSAQVRRSHPSQKNDRGQAGEYRISGPYIHRNLTIFLIHGKERSASRNTLTLEEALKQKKVIVYETKDVNELAIRNLSQTEDIFVQSGDIVKGGQQDRTIGVDLIVPPNSGRIKLAAFCVENGRWEKRGNEVSSQFSSSSSRVATRDIKLAVVREGSQSQVWAKVAEAQDKLSNNVGTRVNSSQSESSLQLTLENKQVQETADSYIKALGKIIAGQPDVIGYAFAINGQVNSADVYASNALFRKLWPRLLEASAVEAIAELQPGQPKAAPVPLDRVESFIDDAEGGKATGKDVTTRIQSVTRETKENILLETRDRARSGAWIHKTYIKKD